MSTLRPLAAVAWLTVACGSPAQEAPVTAAFDLPADTLLTRYGNVPDAAWVGGQQWVVVSPEYSEAILADFSADTIVVLGGRGEMELRNPFTVYGFADTGYVADWGTRRVTAWASEGSFLGGVQAPDDLRGALPRARDAAGSLYFEIPPPPSRDGSSNRDSAAVVRSNAALTTFDTVARLAPLDLAEIEDVSGRRFARRVFSGSDVWGIFPDGALWVARVYGNRVDLHEPDGSIRRGQPLPDRILEVTRVDREHWLLQFPEELRSTAGQLPFSPIKPPFEEGLTGPDGTVWLEKSKAAVDSTRLYHVVNRQGRLARVLELPSRQGHVVAVGDTLALVAEQYREGVRLMQVRIPR